MYVCDHERLLAGQWLCRLCTVDVLYIGTGRVAPGVSFYHSRHAGGVHRVHGRMWCVMIWSVLRCEMVCMKVYGTGFTVFVLVSSFSERALHTGIPWTRSSGKGV